MPIETFIIAVCIFCYFFGWFSAQKEIIIDFTRKKSECKKCGEKDGGEWKYCSTACMEMLVSENNG